MPEITSIKQQKKKDRVNVYLDNKFGFGIDLDNFVLLNLRVGQELSEIEIEEIVKKSEFQKVLDKILKFAMIRPRSKREIEMWLRRKKVSDVIHKDLFSKLKYFDLFDDEKFAKWWVGQRLQFNNKSKKNIEYELKIKGINQEIIKNVLEESEIDERKIAMNLLKSREYSWKGLDIKEKQKKMSEYLMRKGFNWELVKIVVAKILKKG